MPYEWKIKLQFYNEWDILNFKKPVFGKYEYKIGIKTCFNIGAIMQGVSGLLFAFVPYLDNVAMFLSLSYVLRFLEGLGTAMAWSSSLGILTDIFPDKVS